MAGQRTQKRTFESWMSDVNKEILHISEVSSMDIDDFSYYDCYMSEMTPKEAAIEALENAGFPFSEDEEN